MENTAESRVYEIVATEDILASLEIFFSYFVTLSAKKAKRLARIFCDGDGSAYIHSRRVDGSDLKPFTFSNSDYEETEDLYFSLNEGDAVNNAMAKNETPLERQKRESAFIRDSSWYVEGEVHGPGLVTRHYQFTASNQILDNFERLLSYFQFLGDVGSGGNADILFDGKDPMDIVRTDKVALKSGKYMDKGKIAHVEFSIEGCYIEEIRTWFSDGNSIVLRERSHQGHSTN